MQIASTQAPVANHAGVQQNDRAARRMPALDGEAAPETLPNGATDATASGGQRTGDKIRELLGFGPQPHLPARVRDLVRQQDARAEQLICWAQFLLALGLGAFYLFSPKPNDANAGMVVFTPIPVAVSAYLAFNALRLWLAYRGRMPTVLVYLSILVDIGLLLGVIWFFHIQYAQPAAFSLQVPTFIVLFVFIALRALRFDQRFVLAAGVTAALGWAALLVYALLQDDPRAPVTQNFIEYIRGTPILIGAEIEKILMLLTMTAVLAIAIARARRTFLGAVHDRSTREEIGRFLTQGLADQIAQADETFRAGQAVSRNAAVLMLDIRGFTPYATANGPNELIAMLTQFHAVVVPIAERHGGVVDKFLGDGVMITFGAVQPTETASRDAVAAMCDVLDAGNAWLEARGLGGVLDANAAVSSGDLVFATLGTGGRLEYTVIGPAVNLAAKLEKHNKVLATRGIVDRDTYERAVGQGLVCGGHLRPAVEADVQGVGERLDLMVYGTSRLSAGMLGTADDQPCAQDAGAGGAERVIQATNVSAGRAENASDGAERSAPKSPQS